MGGGLFSGWDGLFYLIFAWCGNIEMTEMTVTTFFPLSRHVPFIPNITLMIHTLLFLLPTQHTHQVFSEFTNQSPIRTFQSNMEGTKRPSSPYSSLKGKKRKEKKTEEA
jgi:hypothetical protein